MKSLLIVLPLALSMAACQPGSDSNGPATPTEVVQNQNPQAPEATSPAPSSEVSVTVSVERDAEPSAITVRLVKDSSSFGIESVQRLDMITGESVAIPLNGVDIVDRLTSPRSDLRPWHYKYLIQTNLGQVVKEVRELKDLILSEAVRISEFQIESNRVEVRQLILKEGAVLITEGRDLQIDAEELRSGPLASIQTFSSKDVEMSNTVKVPGKGGGRLILNLNHATGIIEIQMRGHRGSKGEKGIDASQERPAQAAAGKAGEYFAGFPRGPDYGGEKPSCSRQPTDGQAGTAGVAGADGFDGFPGGASGSVYLNLKSARFFDYKVTFAPGEGGMGGEGGKGQPGGLGGPAGGEAPLCKKAKAGANGQDGRAGNEGKKGPSGALGEFCLTKRSSGTSCETREIVTGGVL